jgi:hypothetical protein
MNKCTTDSIPIFVAIIFGIIIFALSIRLYLIINPSSNQIERMKHTEMLADSWALSLKLPNYNVTYCKHKPLGKSATCSVSYGTWLTGKEVVQIYCEPSGCEKIQ